MNPLEVSISGVHDLPDLGGLDAVISIRDPGDERPELLKGLELPIFDLVFHDVGESPDDLDTSPELWQLERLQRFLDDTHPERVHVHCFYGASRSTAVSSFVLAKLSPELSDQDIVKQVLAVRPQAQPNRAVLALADELLGRELSAVWSRQLDRF